MCIGRVLLVQVDFEEFVVGSAPEVFVPVDIEELTWKISKGRCRLNTSSVFRNSTRLDCPRLFQ